MFGPGPPHPINNPIVYAAEQQRRSQQQLAATYGYFTAQPQHPDPTVDAERELRDAAVAEIAANAELAVQRCVTAATALFTKHPANVVERCVRVLRNRSLRKARLVQVMMPSAYALFDMDWYVAGHTKRPARYLTGVTLSGHLVPLTPEWTVARDPKIPTEKQPQYDGGTDNFWVFPAENSGFGGWLQYAAVVYVIEQTAASEI